MTALAFDPISALLEGPAGRAHVAQALARFAEISARHPKRAQLTQAERVRRRELNATRRRRVASLRAWMASTGMGAADFICEKLDANVSQRELHRQFLAYASEHFPGVVIGTWCFNLEALGSIHGAKGSPARLRVEAAARARGDRYFVARRNNPSLIPAQTPETHARCAEN